MPHHDKKPRARPASILQDAPHDDSWRDSTLIRNYHKLGSSAIAAAALYSGCSAQDTAARKHDKR